MGKSCKRFRGPNFFLTGNGIRRLLLLGKTLSASFFYSVLPSGCDKTPSALMVQVRGSLLKSLGCEKMKYRFILV